MYGLSRLKQEITTLRFIIAALLISIVAEISYPIRFPETVKKIDFMWIYILGVTAIAALAAYVSYKRKVKELKRLSNGDLKNQIQGT